MDDRLALLAGVLADPDDDAPRLVFADWLEERGESERARFVRLQCRCESLSPESPERHAAEDEAFALLVRREDDWLPDGFRQVAHRWRWCRGFVDAARLDVWRLGFPELLRPEVPLRHVQLAMSGRLPDGAAGWPVWDAVRSVELAGVAEGDLPGVRQLLDSDRAQGLHAVRLDFDPGTPEQRAVRQLEPVWAGRRWSAVHVNRLGGAAAVHELLAGPPAARLRAFTAEPGSDAAVLAFLDGSPELTHLDLTNAGLTDAGLAGVLERFAGRGLRSLSLSGGVERLLDTVTVYSLRRGDFTGLRALRLRRYGGSPSAVADLLAGDSLPALAELELEAPKLGDHGLEIILTALGSRPGRRLAALSLPNCGLTDRGAEWVARYPAVPSLAYLNLSASRVGNAGLAALARSETLPHLRGLSLRDARVSLHGVAALAQGGLRSLRVLDLGHLGNAAEQAARYLAGSPNLPALRSFRVELRPGPAAPTDHDLFPEWFRTPGVVGLDRPAAAFAGR